MDEKEIIAVNGDSFTQELHLPLEKRWTTLIGANFNMGAGGVGNDRIWETTIEFLNSNITDTLIIGWSTWNRGCLPAVNGDRYVICGNDAWFEDGGINTNDPDVNKFYYKKLMNEYSQFKKTLHYMIFLQDYCKLKKIKLVYFMAWSEIKSDVTWLSDKAKHALMNTDTLQIKQKGIEYNTKILQNLIEKLDNKIWINQQLFFNQLDYLKDYPRADDGYHLGHEASQIWADIIKRHIN